MKRRNHHIYLTCCCIYKGYPLSGTDLDSLSLMLVQSRTADFPLWHFYFDGQREKRLGDVSSSDTVTQPLDSSSSHSFVTALMESDPPLHSETVSFIFCFISRCTSECLSCSECLLMNNKIMPKFTKNSGPFLELQ